MGQGPGLLQGPLGNTELKDISSGLLFSGAHFYLCFLVWEGIWLAQRESGVSALCGQPGGAGAAHGRVMSLLSSCLQQLKADGHGVVLDAHTVVSLWLN